MDQIITRDTLEQAGIELNGTDVDALLTHLNEQLEERVGAEVVASLSDDKLKELSELQESGSDEQLIEWMSEHVPELGEITKDEIDILIGELAENADGLNAAA